MSHDEVSILVLGINGHGRMHDAGKAADHEHGDETQGKEHGSFEDDSSTPHRTNPIEDLYAGRYGNEHSKHGKGGCCDDSHTGCEHVVTPNGKSHEAYDAPRKDDQPIPEERLTGKDRDNF